MIEVDLDLDPETSEAVRVIAEAHDITPSDVIQHAVQEYLDRRSQEETTA